MVITNKVWRRYTFVGINLYYLLNLKKDKSINFPDQQCQKFKVTNQQTKKTVPT